jgi:hypothetical protein
MDIEAKDRQTRAIAGSTIGRDFQLITFTAVISNSVTLYIISFGTQVSLAVATTIITTLIFVLVAGLNQIDTFKNWIADMDEKESDSNIGRFAKKAPFTFWKSLYALCFSAVAIAQLYEIWSI